MTHYTGNASGDGGAAVPINRWRRTTLEGDVTLGITLNRTWHFGDLPDLSDKPEHREVLKLKPLTPTTLELKSGCSDAPINAIVEYTATDQQFTIWIPGVRKSVFVRQP